MSATQTQLKQDLSPATDQSADFGGKYLTFNLADEVYGIDIRKIHEINGVSNITPVPSMPDFMKGVINLRGNVIPIIDLRLKIGMCETEYNEETCVVVVDIGRDVGIVVDSVSEVLDIDPECIKPAPPMGAGVDNSYILGMGNAGDSLTILIDIERVLGGVHADDFDEEVESEV